MAKLMTVVCSYCKGKGKVDEECDFPPNLSTCPVCNGKKELRVPSNYRRCNVCGGGGRKVDDMDPMGAFSRCRPCKGSGWGSPPPIMR